MSRNPRQGDERSRAGDENEASGERVRPEWDDEYLDRVADRLQFNYDLWKDERVHGERFSLYGQLRIESHKQFFHPALDYARQTVHKHLFVRRVRDVSVPDLERYVELGEELAGDWVEPDEEHRGTEFTFVLVAPQIPTEVRSFVKGFRQRTLLRYGFHGHYEINLVVVAPEREDHGASRNADVWRAFALWAPREPEPEGLLSRLVARLRR